VVNKRYFENPRCAEQFNSALQYLKNDNIINKGNKIIQSTLKIQYSNQNLACISGKIANKDATILLDSGAEANCISEEFYESNHQELIKFITVGNNNVCLQNANGSTLNYDIILKMPIKMGTQIWNELFFVIKNLPMNVLIGHPTQTEKCINLINSQEKAVIKNKDNTFDDLPFLKKQNKLDDQIHKITYR
jgi:hypothetical protein